MNNHRFYVIELTHWSLLDVEYLLFWWVRQDVEKQHWYVSCVLWLLVPRKIKHELRRIWCLLKYGIYLKHEFEGNLACLKSLSSYCYFNWIFAWSKKRKKSGDLLHTGIRKKIMIVILC